jgi:hypothetical protein
MMITPAGISSPQREQILPSLRLMKPRTWSPAGGGRGGGLAMTEWLSTSSREVVLAKKIGSRGLLVARA